MVALPAFKFVFLAIRQVTRPVARQIVARANTKRALTYRVCIGLGRVSLGLSGVISEWTRAEEQKLKEAKRKSEEESSAKAAAAQAAQSAQAASDVAKKAAGAAMDAVGAAAAPVKSSAAAAAVVAEPAAAVVATKESSSESAPAPAGRAAATPATVTPRSRSLLQSVVYGPQPKGGVVDTYDSSVFLDPSRTVGEAARVFIRYPTRSAWDVFRQTFLDPFPEDRLVAAGADLLIELVAYTVLCTLLVVELLQQSRTSAAKEAHLQARLEAIESKVNELVEHNNSSTSAQQVEELPPVPELHVTGRLGALWGALTGGVGLVEGAFVGDGGGASAAEERERLAQSGKAVVPQRRSGSSVACAPPRDPSVKVSKHDDSVLLQAELDHLLRTAVHVEKRT
ncbi:Optic atrophy 3 protein (OPA3) [Novymonas esmeraldas]|uniref:Optic atrophy 3 protein (OPA3) n=1 Tax=Novymonas esmeraldas TaxID=1808958 RepID=A0AAW0F645_9TRYP